MNKTANEVALALLIEELKRQVLPVLSVPKQYLNEKEAGNYVGLSVHTLRSYRSKGGGSDYFKVQSRVLYRRDDLDRWAEKYRVKGANK